MNTFISHQTDITQSYPMFLKTPHYIIVTINLGGFHEGLIHYDFDISFLSIMIRGMWLNT